MRNKIITWLMALLIITSLVLFSGCTQDTGVTPDEPVVDGNNISDTDGGDYIYGKATVQSIDILQLESFPVQVNVVAAGYLPDGCTEIDGITEERNGNTFTVTLTTKRPADMMCTEAIVPFEKVISLDVYGLGAGTYDVDVNGINGSFTLQMDNFIDTGENNLKVHVITEEDNGTTLGLDTGNTFTIQLDENPTTGYQWSLETTDGLEITGDNYLPPDTDLVGAGGVHEWDIEATGSGTQKITAVYSRSWENLTGSEQRFELTVEVV